MGGIGSGRLSTRPRASVEESIEIDIDEMRRDGTLAPGKRSVTTISITGRPVVSFECIAGVDGLSVRQAPGPSQAPVARQRIAIARRGCHLGGSRAFLVCPGDHCQAPRLKLYLRDGLFRCRQCHDLFYASQRNDRWDRSLRRANRLREELGGKPGTQQLIAPRPRGMWHSTYNRKRLAIIEAEHIAMQWLAERYKLHDRLAD